MVAVLSVGGGHDHVLTVGFSIGPTLLRVVLLAAVPLVAGFVLLRGFLAEPDRRTTAAVVGVAGAAAVIELLVSGGLRLPAQVVPLLLAGLAVPMYVLLSRDPRFAPLVEILRRVAPWLFAACACLALVEFARAWLSAGPDGALPGLHTGVVLALVGLAWFAVARPRARATTVGVRVAASVVALALTAGTAHAVVLRPADPVPGVPTAARIALGDELVDVVVVPNRPGWNLVHVAADGAEVGTSADELTPARPRPGTSGGWAAVELPEGPGDVWVRAGGEPARLSTDTGTGGAAPAGLTGPDGPECAGALLGA
ncbi:MAG: DUF6239 family natural product biosynthesis protein, partial [Actinophytocola sp.]|uniref:DUF6239 family natural product biosynthesis protein n=1 Tax=Actinophytocola sp. TaxID=1872138 RepID=UPI003D6C6244